MGLVQPGEQPDGDQGERDDSESPLQGAARATAAALKETTTRLVNTLRELLQTVRGLLRAVVALLRLILVALREGLMAAVRPVGGGLGAVAGKVTNAVTS